MQINQTDPFTEHAHGEALSLHDQQQALMRGRTPHRRTNRERMAFLQSRMGPVIVNQGYGDPGEWIANGWSMEWPACTIHEAIDAAMHELSYPIKPWWHWRRYV